MTKYYLNNESKRFDSTLKKIKTVAKQTKTKIMSIEDRIKMEEVKHYEGEDAQGNDQWRVEQVPHTITKVVIA
jgi:hypothetical protein